MVYKLLGRSWYRVEVLSACPSKNHYRGIYCKLCFWKSVKKVNVQDFWEDEYPSYDTFSSYSGHLKINLNVKVWMKMHYMLHSNHMSITHNLKQLWFPKYFCTPDRPFEEQPHYMMMKSRHMLENHHVMESHY